MAQRKRGSYGKAYAFGADSALALEGMTFGEVTAGWEQSGSDTFSRRATGRSKFAREREKKRGVRMWVLVLAAALVLFSLSMVYMTRCVQASAMNKQLHRMRAELARVVQINEGLEVRIRQKGDDTRIQTAAINRLGMKQATEDRVYTVEPVTLSAGKQSAAALTENTAEKSGGAGDVFSLLLHMIGL